MLRLLQHGDGGLALFNGSNEGEDLQIGLVLQRAASGKGPLQSAPASGFQRLQAGRTLVLVDCGRPPPPGYDRLAHARTLSFAMSVGPERLDRKTVVSGKSVSVRVDLGCRRIIKKKKIIKTI